MELVPVLRKNRDDAKNEEDIEFEKHKPEINKKSLLVNEILEKEAEERASSSDEDSEEDEDAKWDCESVLTTQTNTDNHPGIIKTIRKIVKPKMKMELHKQFKVPIEGLAPMAEEVKILKEKKL